MMTMMRSKRYEEQKEEVNVEEEEEDNNDDEVVSNRQHPHISLGGGDGGACPSLLPLSQRSALGSWTWSQSCLPYSAKLKRLEDEQIFGCIVVVYDWPLATTTMTNSQTLRRRRRLSRQIALTPLVSLVKQIVRPSCLPDISLWNGYLCVYLRSYLSVSSPALTSTCLCACLSTFVYAYLRYYMPICLPISIAACESACLSVSLHVWTVWPLAYIFICPSVCLSACLPLSVRVSVSLGPQANRTRLENLSSKGCCPGTMIYSSHGCS